MKQLELELTQGAGHEFNSTTCVYKFDAGALIEEFGDKKFIYGLWGKLFGAWEVDKHCY